MKVCEKCTGEFDEIEDFPIELILDGESYYFCSMSCLRIYSEEYK